MNRKGLALGVALLASVGVVSAVAASGGHYGKGHGRGHGHGGWHEGGMGGGHGFGRGGKTGRMMQLKQRDADNDGTVTLEEFLKPRMDRFAKLDKSSDGVLDAAELTADMQAEGGQRQRMMMARLDADGDGKVTKDEFENASHHGRRGGRRGHHGYHRGHYGKHDGMKQRDDAAEGSDAAGGNAEAPRGEQRREKRAEYRAQRFDRLDVNGDGVITATDLEARKGERIGWFQKKQMHVLDKDGDGKVTQDEFTARSKQHFADVDLDKDGKITAFDLPPGMADRWTKKADQDNK